jgi:hypothetical protein
MQTEFLSNSLRFFLGVGEGGGGGVFVRNVLIKGRKSVKTYVKKTTFVNCIR